MELFRHQIDGVEFLKRQKKAILADEMGLGKTIQAIIAAREGAGVLVICPASLKINWEREIKAEYPDDKIAILATGTDAVRANDLDIEQCLGSKIKWFIINYDIVGKKIETIEAMIKSKIIDTMILDEAHYIKGKSIRATAIIGGRIKRKSDGQKLEFFGLAPQMSRVYCLTGTPLLNRPIEMFNLLKAIGHETGRNRSFFSRRYCGAYLKTIIRRYAPPIRFMDESGASHLDELREKIKDVMIRRTKNETLDLPEKIISVMECELTAEWRKKYEMTWDNYLEFLKEHPDPTKNIDNIMLARQLVEIQKLKQVCSEAKVDRISEDIGNAVEQGNKVIVFSQYKKTIEKISDEMRGRKIGFVTLTGENNSEERQAAVDDFQNDENIKVFIANIKAGGVGITLTEASIVMFADMDWSPQIHNQAIDRAHRIGQTKMINAYFYVATGTIEDDIAELLKEKEGVIQSVLEGGEIETTSMFKQLVGKMAKRGAVDNSLALKVEMIYNYDI